MQTGETMSAIVKAKDVAEHLDMLMEGLTFYLNKLTGEIVPVTEEELHELEWSDPDDLPKWLQDAAPQMKEILESEDYVPLPTSFDVHEWAIMKQFADSQDEPHVGGLLLDAIHGPGAFRMFRATIERLAILDEWVAFKNKALEKIAVEWLEAEGIAYE